jgi:predicted enzyme related to lactoylglutathione lyase
MSAEVEMSADAVLRVVDAVTVPVPDLDQGLAFYRDGLGHELIWRNDEIGQAGLRLPDGQTEIVLSTDLAYAPNWLVTSVPEAVARIRAAGGAVVVEPHAIAVGRLAVVTDPFGNALILLDLSHGRYAVDGSGQVTGVEAYPPT